MIFKVDFEKAFDSVRWDYMDDVLKKFGFGDRCLHVSFQNIVNEGMFKGVSIGSNLHLSHLFYVDDVVFMGQWCNFNISTIIRVLKCFYLASGLRINMHKSKLMGIAVDDDKVYQAASRIGGRLSLLRNGKLGLRALIFLLTLLCWLLATMQRKESILIPTGKERPYEESPIVGLRERMNLRLHLQAIQRKQCASTATQRGIGSGLKESRRLKHGELNLIMGNRKITPAIRIGKFELMLKSGVRIDLNNCCYSSEMTRNIILFHVLFKDGYQFSFDNENGDILVYSNGCFMFKASPCKGIYEIVCISNNGNMIINVGSSNELDKSKLWHSRLGHVNKKHIAQLQKDGVLESFDFKSDDVPIKDGKRYYVTFTDDFSRYGYVYLIKHKSDNFEVFKRYQNEVENELGRKIMGCEVFVRREAHDKLEARSEKYLFFGYPEESFGYLLYKPKDNVSADEEPIVNTDTQQEVVTHVEPDDISLPIRRTSSRVSKPHQYPQFYYGFHIEEDTISDSTLNELDEPANYKEAMASPEAAK
uniref:RNA-directed DNA polymerase, eukaryota n=1 Tax=Tanacetum cinerariifolium TaxID=118510 RepID=A0A6L2NWB0_TANCI|nr:RNA-directed DNA polymerase, eukaryota [Tanacetum cinerariifolium]